MYAASRTPLGLLTGSTLFDVVSHRSDSWLLRAAAVLAATAATCMAAQISIPFTPVPFTLQPMVVLLGAAALGSRLGMASQVLYLTLGIAGLPVFAASPFLPPGLGRLLGPTGGFLLAYPVAAFVTGMLAERHFDRRYVTSFLAMLAGLGVVYLGGITGVALAPPAPGLAVALATVAPFVLGDFLKLAIAAGILPSLWRLMARKS